MEAENSERIIANLSIPLRREDVLCYSNLLKAIRRFEINMGFDDFMEIQDHILLGIKKEEEYIETDPGLNKLFAELNLKTNEKVRI